MAGRSLKGPSIDKEYSTDSDIDTLIVSEHLFTSYVMKSLAWVKDITKPDSKFKPPKFPSIEAVNSRSVGSLSNQAHRGIWRPDSLPNDAEARQEFFERFAEVSLRRSAYSCPRTP